MRPLNRQWIENVFRAATEGENLAWAVVEWYAQDRFGRLAAFESVGQPIPRDTVLDIELAGMAQ